MVEQRVGRIVNVSSRGAFCSGQEGQPVQTVTEDSRYFESRRTDRTMGRNDSNVRLAVDDREYAQAAEEANVSHSRRLTASFEEVVAGDPDALNRLVPLVYDELHEIAHHHLRAERPSHTLSTTAIVHEAYLRLADVPSPSWQDRAHFLAISSRVIRHILIDYERRRTAEKRGGNVVRVPLNEDLAKDQSGAGAVEFLALDAALSELARHDPRLEQVVECRFFGGLTGRETAEVLGVSKRTVERDWARARAYLRRALLPVTDEEEKKKKKKEKKREEPPE